MVKLKTQEEIGIMIEGGRRLRQIRQKLLDQVRAGIKPTDIDQLAKKLIEDSGGVPSFLTVKGYQWSTCICVNEVVVHGIPGKIAFDYGDVVGVDVGMLYQGYHTDTAWTVQVKNPAKIKNNIDKFLETGELALNKAIQVAKEGSRVGHISQVIQNTIEGASYNVVRSLVGHGIGKKLHEPPQIPGVLTQPISDTLILKEGMVIAIEVIYNLGKPDIESKFTDRWTLVTKDSSISGLFEHTVAVTSNDPVILT